LEWETANVECDKITQSVVGKKVLENPEFEYINCRHPSRYAMKVGKLINSWFKR